ncbi:MAG: hypothetical protein GY886_01845 [Gammaproteobacteria bacterium]|nr:hypothetical protein [Gammaproteobacteria bacterium]
MKLEQLASKPQLTKLTIDNPDIVETYGEELEFYVWDRLDMATYTRLAGIDQSDVTVMYTALRDMILDDSGKPVMTDEMVLPMDVMTAAVEKVVSRLGK